MLKQHEGLRLSPYKCTANKITIGYGCNIQDTENAQMLKFYNLMSFDEIVACMDMQEDFSITEETAETILKVQLERTEKEAKKLIPNFEQLSQDRQDAMTDMLFNLGATKFLKFRKMLAALEAKNYKEAAKQMLDSKWSKQVKKRAQVLALMMKLNIEFNYANEVC